MPEAKVVRRRRAAVLAIAAAAFVLGASFGAGDEQPQQPVAELPSPSPSPLRLAAPKASPEPSAVERLSLREQVGKLVVLRFQGTTAPDYVRNAVRRGWTAGAILFRDNITSPEQLRALTRQLRRGAPVTPIVCTDQEGGAIRNIAWAPPASAQAGQTPRRDARAAARALRSLGINVTLAPVADVPSVAGAAMAGREFSSDANEASEAIKAAVEGWRAGGVAATAKHFPGLGGAVTNTDDGSASINGAPTDADLAPFKAAIDARVPLIMSSHARYPRLDADRIASQSPAILTDLLRRELGYEGVVMTDSIEAAAARATGSTEEIAIRSIQAGNDIVLTTGQGSWIRVFRALVAEARTSRAFRERVQASAARVLALQKTLK
ncbi:MAG TPA: glycoside hydrolase family 3 N-terminal domain-containing protein [Solirubrobacter sp.]|nr:glycoside hydrolase family 3 N-terminal domain-containing protein [Solirubrobacter sp.]